MERLLTALEPLADLVDDHQTGATVAALVLALFIAKPIVALAQTAGTGLMAVAGLYVHVGGILALTLAVWLTHAAVFPERKHFWCRGRGRFSMTWLFIDVSRECRGCNGSGRRLRLGRRLLTPILGAPQ